MLKHHIFSFRISASKAFSFLLLNSAVHNNRLKVFFQPELMNNKSFKACKRSSEKRKNQLKLIELPK